MEEEIREKLLLLVEGGQDQSRHLHPRVEKQDKKITTQDKGNKGTGRYFWRSGL